MITSAGTCSPCKRPPVLSYRCQYDLLVTFAWFGRTFKGSPIKFNGCRNKLMITRYTLGVPIVCR
eukprot:2020791-Amphidinium_carterae.1